MKKKIFNVLMEAKAEVIKWIQSSNKHPITAVAQDSQQISDFKYEPVIQFVPLEDNPPTVPLIVMANIAPETRYFQIQDEQHPRKIAYTVSGDVNAENILICLPGLLETKASFLGIHDYF